MFIVDLWTLNCDLFRRLIDWNIARHVRRGASGARPVDGIANHPLDFRLMINWIQLVAGTEIKNASGPARPATAAAQHVAAFKPRDENQFLRLRNRERLAIHFAVWNFDELAQALRDFVRGIHHPEPFAFPGFAPAESACRSHHALENF